MEISGLEQTLLIMSAVLLAANQGLKEAPELRKRMPAFLKSGRWNYLPLCLIIIALCHWGWGHEHPTQQVLNPETRPAIVVDQANFPEDAVIQMNPGAKASFKGFFIDTMSAPNVAAIKASGGGNVTMEGMDLETNHTSIIAKNHSVITSTNSNIGGALDLDQSEMHMDKTNLR